MAGEATTGPGYRDFPMPELLVASAQAWLDTPVADRRPQAVAKPSATVLLLRDPSGASAPGDHAVGGLEVFVLLRVPSMPFAPGMIAFPGGGVDPRDSDPVVPWAGTPDHEWATRLGTGTGPARELVIAAARELFEECGVLLAGPDPGSVVADLTDPAWDAEREALLSREQSFGELLTRRRLVLRADLLRLRAHWITPECEPRRYDTRFFAARIPAGQVADDRTSEASNARWVAPEALLAEQAAGEVAMLPPTQVMVEQVAAAGDIETYLAERPAVGPVMPEPAAHSDAMWMRAPIDAAGHARVTDEAQRRD